VERCLAVLGARPVEWLLNTQEIDARWCLVHATHVTRWELASVAASGATVGLCPITEADLGDGVFPAADYMSLNGVWGVGTDSNVLIDLAGELRLLEYGQRLWTGQRNVLAREARRIGRSLFEAALKGGRQALGSIDQGIEAGAPATLVSLALSAPSMQHCDGDETLDAWIFAARRSPVDCVWRRGRLVVKDGVHYDRARIEAAYAQALNTLPSS